jgi:hypothetical protein
LPDRPSNAAEELSRRYSSILAGPIHPRDDIAFAIVAPTKTPGCGGFRHGSSLANHPGLKEAAPNVWRWARREQDAPWVRARLERLFQMPSTPAGDQGEKCCFNTYVAAVIPNTDGTFEGIIFICCDYYGASEIMFEEPAPHQEPLISPLLRRRLAASLWDLLLDDVNDVQDYADRMYHSGAGVWIRFGIRRGRPFMIEEAEE